MISMITGNIGSFYRSLCGIATIAKQKKLVIYGAGFWGKKTMDIFRKFNVDPICFCDDDREKIGVSIFGIPVLSLDDAQELYPNAVYIAASKNTTDNAPRRRMNNNLQRRGLLTAESGFHPFRYLFLDLIHPKMFDNYKHFPIPIVNDFVMLNQMGRSGVTYLDSLLDGHPEIISIPNLGIWSDFPAIYKKRLKYLKDEELCVELMAQLTPTLNEVHEMDENGVHISRTCWQTYYIYDKNGDPDWEIMIKDANYLYHVLRGIFIGKGYISFVEMINGIFAAYYIATGRANELNRKKLLVFHDHKNNIHHKDYDELFDEGARFRIIYCIREPISDCYSYLKFLELFQLRQENFFLFDKWKDMVADYIGCSCLRNSNSEDDKVIRFEDLKANTRGVMHELCKWLKITWDDCLLVTTANGREIYQVKKKDNGESVVISGRDIAILNERDKSDMFTQKDIENLRIMFQPFIRRYYQSSNEDDDNLNMAYESMEFEGPFIDMLKVWHKRANKMRFESGKDIILWAEFKNDFWNYVRQCEEMIIRNNNSFCEIVGEKDKE